MQESKALARLGLGMTITFFALVYLPLGGLNWQPEVPAMYAHFINVGQADATLPEFPCGAVLIDAGSQDDATQAHLIDYLNKFFNRRSDLNRTLKSVIITHAHIDHTRSLRTVAETFTVEHFVDSGLRDKMGGTNVRWMCDQIDGGQMPGCERREVLDSAITALPSRTGLSDQHIDPVSCPNCDPRIRILSGQLEEDPGWSPGEFSNYNNHSLVVRVDFGQSSFLITGDLEEPAIETLLEWYDGTELLDIDVYHVGHHGSHNGTTMNLLEEMTPQIAVISMGFWNFGKKPDGKAKPFTTFAYGHPRLAILEMLRPIVSTSRSSPLTIMAAAGARRFQDYTVTKRIYATGWDGDIAVRATQAGDFRVLHTN